MKHAGVAQHSEHPVTSRKVAGADPAPRSITIAQAVVAGLALDDGSRDRGRADGSAGLPWRPPEGCDVLAYALGHYDGTLDRGSRLPGCVGLDHG